MSQPMSAAVSTDTQGRIGIITLHNPPVNALSKAVRTGVRDAMTHLLQDAAIDAVVISSDIGLFSGGADISEFATGDVEPPLPDVLELIEQADKPVVAAINGPAFGGGLELALACHYRVAVTGVKVGLPEVHLGILPGAGGTQRLPRLTNVETALNMIVSGQPAAVQSLSGLTDALVDTPEALLETACNLAQAAVGKPIPRTSDKSVAAVPDGFFEGFRKSVARQTRGFYAPERCIRAVEASLELPFEQGLEREGALFMECMKSPQARAQQHFFFAERAAGHVADYDRDTPTRPIARVGIIGAGTMGGGIAMNFANAGIPVRLLEIKPEALEKGLAVIRRNYENSARKGKLTEAQVEQRMALLQGTTEYADLADVDLVIEAVFEKMAVKKAVFEQLDAVCKPGAILATNTSTLDVNEIARATSRPGDVIGMHFFSPANVMKLLEVVKADDTQPDVIKTVMQLAKTIKKVAVLVGVCFGFVGNRMIEPYSREANRLLLEGASPQDIDRVLYEFGLPMGPFTMGDMAGLDIGYFVRESRRDAIAHDPSYCVVADKLVEAGRVGLKAGRGAYRYEEGNRTPIPDPEVLDIARQEAERLGVQQRDISEQEILERILYPLINEGCKILEEGIASKASDIDVIYVYGYGFPIYRGGPMHYAETIGLDNILTALKGYQKQLGQYGQDWFTPAPLLENLAASGQTFAQWAKQRSQS
ncbi:enoyl-CoA hydratase/isomerase family protein [Aestuariibacter halophilus]|uniref:Enoyl-CoA hydratase/isomerase family protein n=1 Tax=Fluctibacter halophilus TaxID=226011 RepID=A0ABS8G3Y9_9ALTE|nr:3-hydroxyacyl-CoA dehydrogenase NAD-binding domain-containing protein [Aestuariibacter halophilus]MCC2615214.1 enoyl-CoA hydratase/isomerase family protein [Aestuariibacter halophilus]